MELVPSLDFILREGVSMKARVISGQLIKTPDFLLVVVHKRERTERLESPKSGFGLCGRNIKATSSLYGLQSR